VSTIRGEVHYPPEVIAEAARALHGIGRDAKEALPALIKALGDRRNLPVVRTPIPVCECAAEALGSIGPQAAPATLPLIELAKDKRLPDSTRCAALDALGSIGPAAKQAIPILKTIAAEEQREERFMVAGAALEAIRSIDPKAEKER
jgi:HEAT repeat protein